MRSPIDDYLHGLLERCRAQDGGAVADYIPELARVDPELTGICLATIDGHVYEAGDTHVPFTIQSISKPFAYAMALEDAGVAAVEARIDVEPSGDAFNSISLDPASGRPLNPMINAGAITSTSLVSGGAGAGVSGEERLGRIVAGLSRFAGRPLAVDEDVAASESATGHRNRAIGWMLRSRGILDGDPDATLEVYFRQCAVGVDCRDLSLMAATLANGGVHPLTGERALAREHVQQVLSVMTTCGMYDAAGNWMVRVGLPAKSGVGGGILALLPGQLGLAVFSPRLDAWGNSVRGVFACGELSRDLDLHFLRASRPAHVAIAARHPVDREPSRRRRPAAERELLERVGRRGIVFELQGDVLVASAERIIRAVSSEPVDVAAIDLRDAEYVDPPSVRLLHATAARLREQGRELAFVERAGRDALGVADASEPLVFPDRDSASEWIEDRLLARHGGGGLGRAACSLDEHRLMRELSGEQLAQLAALLQPRPFAAGELIAGVGEQATEVFLLMRGELSTSVPLPDGGRRRLSTVTPGWTVGEMAVLGEGARTADTRADTDGDLLLLAADDFHALADGNPALHAALLRNMLTGAYELAAQLTRELGRPSGAGA
ncbi:glutaminase A [Conexibacter stalactiti]|uniref:Glutaminase n=1 Tax=Conexibacter stalactiti TaxID=1940611 RepID=A0ABU4HN91_9ACTN|nr:glutaminase A [Conexibacter stalactiti]MDW5594744.1 glutaminase A [Conexibacter stalactiti]MEC5035386.1 glutaminase A [Conexibacter stalactiti]